MYVMLHVRLAQSIWEFRPSGIWLHKWVKGSQLFEITYFLFLQMSMGQYVETSASDYPLTQRCSPEDRNRHMPIGQIDYLLTSLFVIILLQSIYIYIYFFFCHNLNVLRWVSYYFSIKFILIFYTRSASYQPLSFDIYFCFLIWLFLYQ